MLELVEMPAGLVSLSMNALSSSSSNMTGPKDLVIFFSSLLGLRLLLRNSSSS